MKPELMVSDDRKRARRAPLRSSRLMRMIRSTLRYRKLLVIGLAASIFYALFHSVSILGALPVLKVLLEDEGLHGWIDRSVVQERLGVRFAVHQISGATDTPPSLVVASIDADSDLRVQGLRAGDEIIELRTTEQTEPRPSGSGRVLETEPRPSGSGRMPQSEPQPSGSGRMPQSEPRPSGSGDDRRATPRELLANAAAADKGELVFLVVRSPPSGETVAYKAVLGSAPAQWRLAHWLARWVPRDDSPAARLRALSCVLGMVVFVVIVANVARFVSEYFVARAVLRAMMDVRRALYAKVLNLPMSYFTRDVGDTVTRFVQDIQDVQRGLLALFGKTVREPLKAAFILTGALILDWRITLTMLLVAPWALLLFWRVGTSIKKANRRLLRGYGTMIDTLSRTLAAISLVKAYTNENGERLRLLRVDRGMFGQQLKIVRLEATLTPALEVLGIVVASLATVWLGGRVLSGGLDLSKFGTLVLALAMLFDPLRKLADVYSRLSRSAAGAERLCETLDAIDEVQVHEGNLELQPIERAIEFKNVTFTYPEGETPALKNVNLTVPRGETIALVGRNGSGKTTLVNLLTRFYDPQEGVVLFDGVDLRDVSLRSLRKQIGLVTQDSIVFPIPLADNIAYGSRNGSREAVIAAARRAYADEFIREKPQGYDTIPGDMGRTLSGGQRQRLAIARAIFRDAPVLIFDEATSQIDADSEHKIQAALQEFARDRTTFIIAHRLSTIKFADRIAVMEVGRIIDVGTHDELLARCALYRALCETQLIA